MIDAATTISILMNQTLLDFIELETCRLTFRIYDCMRIAPLPFVIQVSPFG